MDVNTWIILGEAAASIGIGAILVTVIVKLLALIGED
jgi:hypothetical protein